MRKLARPVSSPKPEPARADDWAAFVGQAEHEVLAATCWLDPGREAKTHPTVVRFSGQRVGVVGKPRPGDHFVRDELVEGVLPGSGPASVTTIVRDVSPGEWVVTAQMLAPPRRLRRAGWRLDGAGVVTSRVVPAVWSWRRWRPVPAEPPIRAKTCLAPLVLSPGVIPGAWLALVGVGVVLAIAMQAAIVGRNQVQIGRAVAVSLVATLAGAVVAKLWYMVLHWRKRLIDGWCIQGFLVGVVGAVVPALLIARLPIGVFFDAAVPGLFLAMALGRTGCFLSGCCSGRPTTSRWGIWSSDRRLGTRRIPTQLLEGALCMVIGLLGLVAILNLRPAIPGALFVASLAIYTLCRQAILRLRAEARRSALGSPLVAAGAIVVLLGEALILIRT